MLETPTISVLLPVYNCSKYIAEAIESILQQTYTNFELIIIDDCSTDLTVREIQKFNDSRIIFLSNASNLGISYSLNIGLKNSRGKYIARMDGDDYSVPNRFELQVEQLNKNPDIILCGSLLKIYGTDQIIEFPETHHEILVALLESCPIAHPSVMVRRDIIDSFRYDCAKEPAEDYDLWTRLIWKGKFYNIQQPLLHYRYHDAQISNINRLIQNEKSVEVRIRYFGNLQYDKQLFSDRLLKSGLLLNDGITVSEFKMILKWVENLKLQNREQHVFPKLEFEKILDKLLHRMVTKIYFTSTVPYITWLWRVHVLLLLPVNEILFIARGKSREYRKKFGRI